MSGRGLEWYKRNPIRYLGGVQGMSAKEHAVYGVIVELIYIHGGSVNNDPKWISGWIADMGAASVRNIIQDLVQLGKISVDGDQISNKKASEEMGLEPIKEPEPAPKPKPKKKAKPKQNETKTKEKQTKNPKFSGPASSQNNDLTPTDKRREEKKKEDTNVSSQKNRRGTRLPENWKLPKAWGQWAIEKGYQEADIRNEAEKFRDFWISKTGQGATKLDWQATWRNWMRNSKAKIGGDHERKRTGSQEQRIRDFISDDD